MLFAAFELDARVILVGFGGTRADPAAIVVRVDAEEYVLRASVSQNEPVYITKNINPTVVPAPVCVCVSVQVVVGCGQRRTRKKGTTTLPQLRLSR